MICKIFSELNFESNTIEISYLVIYFIMNMNT